MAHPRPMHTTAFVVARVNAGLTVSHRGMVWIVIS